MTDQNTFWNVVETARSDNKLIAEQPDEYIRNLVESMHERLAKQDHAYILSYYSGYLQCSQMLRNQKMKNACFLLCETSSPDTFTDFIDVVLLLGKKSFEDALLDPDLLAGPMDCFTRLNNWEVSLHMIPFYVLEEINEDPKILKGVAKSQAIPQCSDVEEISIEKIPLHYPKLYQLSLKIGNFTPEDFQPKPVIESNKKTQNQPSGLSVEDALSEFDF